ncbi:MAG: hypothetical protein J5I52_03520 [Saprospiraceae bacterium]|nr:hypothetical protein [Saprospiraceae bacterium]
MKAHFCYKYIILIICFVSMTITADAQLRKRPEGSSSKTKKERVVKPSFVDRLGGDIMLGNVGFFNGLTISAKLDAAFKINDRFALGGGSKMFYDQYSVLGPDPSVFDIGGHFMGRARIINDIFFQAEYAFMKYSKDPVGYSIRGLTEDVKVNYPLFGLGYMSGVGKWKFAIQLMYIANETARDLQSAVVEYWFGASYNF